MCDKGRFDRRSSTSRSVFAVTGSSERREFEPATTSIRALRSIYDVSVTSQIDEIDASIRDLEASLADAHPDMRGLLVQQIAALRSARELLVPALADAALLRAQRAPLEPDEREFFTPDPLVVPLAWIPDDASIEGLTDDDLRGAPGTAVQRDDDVLRCIVPGGVGMLPTPEGLSLTFHPSGRLASQRFYAQGCLRWSIEYHASGGRESIGTWVDRERFEHREQGQHTRFAPNGTIIAQAYWEAGTRVGWTKLWEDDGYPIGATRYVDGEAVEQRLPGASRVTRPPRP
jgi:hypothetical protein